MTLAQGTALGDSMHPATEDLKAMAYLPEAASDGDVRIMFMPDGCNLRPDGSCVISVQVTMQGVSKVSNKSLR